MSDKLVLSYVGEGRWLPGVPSRDLTEADMDEFELDGDALIESGMYVRAKAGASPSVPAHETENERVARITAATSAPDSVGRRRE